MKIETLSARLAPMLSLLTCPVCGAALQLDRGSLICLAGHCYDLSKRGYVNLAPSHHQSGEKYNQLLFGSRREVLESGFYRPVAKTIGDMLERRFHLTPFTLLDAGCGEGYYTRVLAERFAKAQILGADLSRDAIVTAAKESASSIWLVADLKHLPVSTHALDVVVNILTPADYMEFSRVLKPKGILIKVIPGSTYLKEIREAVSPYLKNDVYDNTRVLAHLASNAAIEERVLIKQTYTVTPAQGWQFLHMTPMTFSVPQEELEKLVIREITLDLEVLCCTLR